MRQRPTAALAAAALLVLILGDACLAREVISLRENWAVQSSAEVGATGEAISAATFASQDWYPTHVPRTVLAALVDNGVYPDPYYGGNLRTIAGYREDRWLVMPSDSPFRRPWWYRTEFEAPASFAGRNIVLHLDGINYKANVWLNGRKIADADSVIGMFRRFEFDVSNYVRPGERNCLAIEIIAPGQGPDIEYRTKQIEATTGWDDHNPYPPDMNMGLWQDVYVTATGPLRMRHPYVASDLDLPRLDVAHLAVSVEVTNTTDRQLTGDVSGAIEDITFSQSVTLSPRETKLVTFSPDDFPQLTVSNPRLWWPNPVGPQELYDLDLVAAVKADPSDSLSTRFGIREATTYVNDEGWRVYMVNGKRILIRGAAWMTSDMLLRLDRRRYDALIRYAREANLNMLRSEGFSIRETEDFFDLCDEYGVMVTQQLFGRSIPDEELAIECVKDTILRIRNHPSLVHFLGHDETFPTENLDQAYRDLIARYTPERTYQPHSGAFAIADRFKTGGTRTGSRQLWTYADPTHYYVDTERGAWGFAQSGGIGGVIAPIESMRRMMPRDALWPPWTDTWSFHTVIQGGRYFDTLREALNARYGPPVSIEEFCMKGQALNYESARAMYEAYGRNKYSATGITQWKYDTAWPASPTWQLVDWYLLVGGAYYGAKKACEALHVQYSYDDNSVWVVNAYYRDFADLTVTARILNTDMTEKYARRATVGVAADGNARAFTIELPEGLTKTYFLSLKLNDASGKEVSSNLYWLSTAPDVIEAQGYTQDREFFLRYKSSADYTGLAELPPVELDVASEITGEDGQGKARVRIHNSTEHLALMVHVAVTKGENGLEVAPTFWEDNYFSLLPGETRTVSGAFASGDLDGATPVVKVEGWNVRVGK